MTKYIFPSLLIIINILAGIIYEVQGDIRKLIYWLAAAILNIAETF